MPAFCHSRTIDFTFSWNLVSSEEYALPKNGLGLGIFGIRDGDVIFILFQDQVELNRDLIYFSSQACCSSIVFSRGRLSSFHFPQNKPASNSWQKALKIETPYTSICLWCSFKWCIRKLAEVQSRGLAQLIILSPGAVRTLRYFNTGFATRQFRELTVWQRRDFLHMHILITSEIPSTLLSFSYLQLNLKGQSFMEAKNINIILMLIWYLLHCNLSG